MLTPDLMRSKFDEGHVYDAYVATGSEPNRAAWRDFHAGVTLTAKQSEVLGAFERRLNVIVSSGTWCGDCVQQVPMLAHIARANPDRITLRCVDRDEHAELAKHLSICGGLRVPIVLILNEARDLLALAGDRTLARYRALAAKQLGPSCPLPGAPVPPDEIAATLQDWVDEVERAHLIARLSTKLRKRHSD